MKKTVCKGVCTCQNISLCCTELSLGNGDCAYGYAVLPYNKILFKSYHVIL